MVKVVKNEGEDQDGSLLTTAEGIDEIESQPGSRRGSIFDSLNLVPSEIVRRDSFGVVDEPRRDFLGPLAGFDVRRGSVASRQSNASEEDVDAENKQKCSEVIYFG